MYLNLGLVYQNQADVGSARKFMEKALNIVKQVTNCTYYKEPPQPH